MTSTSAPTLLQALNRVEPAQADRLMRAALAGLLRWQLGARPAPLPRLDAAQMVRGLDGFATACAARAPGGAWTGQARASWDRVAAALVEQAQAQPFVAVQGHWTADRLVLVDSEWTAADAAGTAPAAASGPVGWDLVGLLRDPAFDWEEPQEIDWAIRWWDAARRAGLPVDADFGAFWRAHEWLGLQRQLVQLGECLRGLSGSPGDAETPVVARLLAGAGRTALRYGPLKPLLRLLEPLSGAHVSAGFTF